ncbi:GSCOCG00008760001-RA-CDS [Cotesia congregata]|nr:GSCOCG00008760001-RA-CDS [Cotesia congregata]
MHFILLLQLLVAMTSAAVISDIGGLYFLNSPKPNEDTDSQNGRDIDGLFSYNSDNFANYPQQSKRDVHRSSDIYRESKSLPIDIDQIYGQKFPVTEMANSKTDDLDGLYSYSNPDGINYPHYARKRTTRQTPDVISELSKDRNSAQDNDKPHGQMSSVFVEPKNGEDDVNTLYIYNNDNGDKYPLGSRQRFVYVNAFGDVNRAIHTDYIRRKNLQVFIEQLKNFNIPGFDAVKFYNDVMDFYHRYNLLPIHVQVQPAFDQGFIDVGGLYQQNGIPRDEMPRPKDIDNLYQYNGNYPVYPQHSAYV